jgi:pimeloyl-ACP methyl ester carboxylesterase
MEVQVLGIPINYEEFGSGRVFLGLHGWPLDHRHMVAEYEPLFSHRSGWRRIYPDLPGMGKTPGADWIISHDQILEVLVAFIEAVAPGERFIVGGTSYGGYIARGVVYRCGDRIDGMMINVPAVERDSTQARLPEHRVIHLDQTYQDEVEMYEGEKEKQSALLSVQTLSVLQHIRKYYDPAGAIADMDFLKQVNASHKAFSFPVDKLPRPFDAPSLILTGRFDQWCGYQDAYDLLGQYPRATFAVLDRAGHGLVMEENNLFSALANDWLDRVEEYIQSQAG